MSGRLRESKSSFSLMSIRINLQAYLFQIYVVWVVGWNRIIRFGLSDGTELLGLGWELSHDQCYIRETRLMHGFQGSVDLDMVVEVTG